MSEPPIYFTIDPPRRAGELRDLGRGMYEYTLTEEEIATLGPIVVEPGGEVRATIKIPEAP